jgi:hypothetical protein
MILSSYVFEKGIKMLKCGQKDNKKYTFGVRREQLEEVIEKETEKICCASCGSCLLSKSNFCPSCGEKL